MQVRTQQPTTFLLSKTSRTGEPERIFRPCKTLPPGPPNDLFFSGKKKKLLKKTLGSDPITKVTLVSGTLGSASMIAAQYIPSAFWNSVLLSSGLAFFGLVSMSLGTILQNIRAMVRVGPNLESPTFSLGQGINTVQSAILPFNQSIGVRDLSLLGQILIQMGQASHLKATDTTRDSEYSWSFEPLKNLFSEKYLQTLLGPEPPEKKREILSALTRKAIERDPAIKDALKELGAVLADAGKSIGKNAKYTFSGTPWRDLWDLTHDKGSWKEPNGAFPAIAAQLALATLPLALGSPAIPELQPFAQGTSLASSGISQWSYIQMGFRNLPDKDAFILLCGVLSSIWTRMLVLTELDPKTVITVLALQSVAGMLWADGMNRYAQKYAATQAYLNRLIENEYTASRALEDLKMEDPKQLKKLGKAGVRQIRERLEEAERTPSIPLKEMLQQPETQRMIEELLKSLAPLGHLWQDFGVKPPTEAQNMEIVVPSSLEQMEGVDGSFTSFMRIYRYIAGYCFPSALSPIAYDDRQIARKIGERAFTNNALLQMSHNNLVKALKTDKEMPKVYQDFYLAVEAEMGVLHEIEDLFLQFKSLEPQEGQSLIQPAKDVFCLKAQAFLDIVKDKGAAIVQFELKEAKTLQENGSAKDIDKCFNNSMRVLGFADTALFQYEILLKSGISVSQQDKKILANIVRDCQEIGQLYLKSTDAYLEKKPQIETDLIEVPRRRQREALSSLLVKSYLFFPPKRDTRMAKSLIEGRQLLKESHSTARFFKFSAPINVGNKTFVQELEFVKRQVQTVQSTLKESIRIYQKIESKPASASSIINLRLMIDTATDILGVWRMRLKEIVASIDYDDYSTYVALAEVFENIEGDANFQTMQKQPEYVFAFV